jgi:hypothetical protein
MSKTAAPTTAKTAFKFHWGHAVIVYFSAFVLFMLFMVYQCMRQEFDLVAEDYYAQEIGYQGDINAQQRAQSMATPATIALHDKILAVNIPAEAAPETGEIYLFRPSATALDKKYALKTEADGSQFLDVSALTTGAYNVQLRWKSGGADYQAIQRIIIK